MKITTSCRPFCSSLAMLSLLGLLLLCASSSSSSSNRFLFFAAAEQDEEENRTACTTAIDCEDENVDGGTYCASDGTCTRIGGCAAVDDCTNVANGPFPMVACYGTMECQGGMCGMNCNGGTESIGECTSSADCYFDNDDYDDNYCASDGICLGSGRCTTVEDCGNMDNVYSLVQCVGTLDCVEGECSKMCDGEEDISSGNVINGDDVDEDETATTSSCMISDDCAGDGEDFYCASNDVCLESGMCTTAEDCGNTDNVYPIIACVGTLDCVEGECSKTCDGEDSSSNGSNGNVGDDTTSCVTSADCGAGDGEDVYCASNDVCLESGMCTTVEDCDNDDNVFPLIECIGTLYCVEGECSKTCGGVVEDSSSSSSDNGLNHQGDDCVTKDDCAGDGEEFCASNDVCLESGMCTTVEDCNNMYNVFPVLLCIGTMECQEGMCAMNCDGDATDDNVVSDIDEVTGCATSDDCASVAEYCSSLGACLSIGECTTLGDCVHEDNAPFPVALCMGSLECQEGTCAMNCGVPPEVPVPDNNNVTSIGGSSCIDTTDCDDGEDSEDEYCASDGTCLQTGECAEDADCVSEDNEFPAALCFGTMECQEGMCAMNCDPINATAGDVEEDFCAADTDCDTNSEYCAQGTCTKKGMCISDSDCMNPNHIFADVMCIGYQYCNYDYDETIDAVVGFCARKCGVQCKDRSRMTEDCDGCDSDNLCVGAVSCRPDSCNECKTIYYDLSGSVITECDQEEVGTDVSSTAEGSDTAVAVDAPSTSCTSDADCISASTTRMSDGDGMYCAQGTCMKTGSCLSDIDCSNPVNVFDDKRCAGYLTCDSSGMCDRICGEMCKNGSRSAMDCPVDPCNIGLCPDSVSCQRTSCDEVCDVVYFDAAGEVLTNCDESVVADGAVDDGTNTKNGSDSSSISKTTEKEADAEPTATLMNSDSGGAFQTMILSASAIFVTSLFLTV